MCRKGYALFVCIGLSQVTKKWNSLIMDPASQVKNHPRFGHCLPIFKGVREYAGTSQGYRQQRENSTTVKCFNDMVKLQETLETTMDLATKQFTSSTVVPPRSAELSKALAPAHLAQGLVEPRGRSTFFDQLVYEELQDAELLEAQREEAFRKDLAEAEQYVREQGLSGASSSSSKPGGSELKLLQLQTFAKMTSGRLQAAHDSCEETSEYIKSFMGKNVGTDDAEARQRVTTWTMQ